jgi:hypothetical protein
MGVLYWAIYTVGKQSTVCQDLGKPQGRTWTPRVAYASTKTHSNLTTFFNEYSVFSALTLTAAWRGGAR